jgi:hypothetical protein
MTSVPPRLKSKVWIDAFLRGHDVAGHFGAVLNRGSEEAGSICIAVNHLDGTFDLLVPPPGPSIDENGNRRFRREFKTPVDWETVRLKMARTRSADPDTWLVEIEDRAGLAGLVPVKE